MAKKTRTVTIPEDLGQRIKKWTELAEWLADAKANEQGLRQSLVNEIGFDATKLEGTESLDIGWGYKLKATKVQSYTATNENSAMEQLLAALHQIDPGLALGFVTRWVPEISTKHYKDIILPVAEKHPELKALLSAAITVKPGMPQLELVAPKVETVVESTAVTGEVVTDGVFNGEY